MNLTQKAYLSVKEKIMRIDITSHTLLNENQIAQELKISRTPVREAVKMLASEGLVEIRDGIGVLVKSLTYKEIKDISEVRKSLQATAFKTSVRNIDDEELDEFLKFFASYKDISQKITDEQLEKLHVMDNLFHNLVIDKCNNNYLIKIDRDISQWIIRLRRISIKLIHHIEETADKHIELIDVIRSRDTELFSRAIAEHIDWSVNIILQNI